MKFMLLVYNDEKKIEAMQQQGQFDPMMRDCFAHVDQLAARGQFVDAQQLEASSMAKSVRVRNGKVSALDGPFAESKEVLGGFTLIEAANIDEAVEIASHVPWAQVGTIEVRPVRDIGTVKSNVRSGQAAWAEQA